LIFGEFDGTRLEVDSTGYKVPTGTDRTGTPTGTPEDFIILGFADMGAGKATMGLYTNGGIVFNAATTSWPRVLSRRDPKVDIITRNVINHLSLRPVRIVGPLPTACGSAVAVEGRTAQFYVDTSAIADSASLSYEWSISAGAGSLLDEPVLEAIMPSPPLWITVTVTVSDSEGHPQGFGTRTFLPLTLTEFLTLTMTCLSRELMPSPAGVSVEDQVWHRIMHEEPLRFARKYHFDSKQLEVIIQRAKHLEKLATDLLKLQKKKK
jgi:hypothetical protein